MILNTKYLIRISATTLAILIVGMMFAPQAALAQRAGYSSGCTDAEVKFSVSKDKVYADEQLELKAEFKWLNPACGQSEPNVHADFSIDKGGNADVGRETPGKKVRDQAQFQIFTRLNEPGFAMSAYPAELQDLLAGRGTVNNLVIRFYVIMEYSGITGVGKDIVESDRIDVLVEKGSAANSAPHADNPRSVTNTGKTGGTGGGKTYSPHEIIFDVETTHSLYRVAVPQVLSIGVKINLAANSVPARFDDTDELARNKTARESDINGLYAAAGPAGSPPTSYCAVTVTPRGSLFPVCHFLERESSSGHAVPMTATIPLRTGEKTTVGSRAVDLTAPPTDTPRVELLEVFPVIDTSEEDEPYATKGAPITVEVYRSDEALKAAAAAAGDTDGDPYTSGPVSKSTTSSPTIGAIKGVTDTIGGAILSVVNIILGIIIGFLRWILWVLGTLIFVPLLETTLSINAADITATIGFGWQFVRDVVNMFFILGLIVIGLGTILKIESSYNYKKLLVNLIIMALLVNFSLVIGRIIIQMADAAQFTFLPETVETTVGGKVTGMTGVKYLFSQLVNRNVSSIMEGLRGMTTDSAGALAATFSLLFQFTLELMTVITFGALAIFMLIRTVALWILLIISPVAYGLAIIPATANLAKRWWSSFVKYALFAPIIAFFLRLALELYQNKITEAIKGLPWKEADFAAVNTFATATGAVSFGDALRMMMEYIIVLAFLWAGIKVTNEMGIAGAAAITGLAAKGIKAPFAGGWKLTKFGAGALDKYLAKGATEGGKVRRGLSYLSLGAWKRGWQIRQKEEEARAYGVSAGQRADTLYKGIRRPTKWGKRVSTAFGLEAHQDEVLRRAKHKMELNLSEREMVEEVLHAENPIERQGWGMAMVAMNRQDDFQRILKEYKNRGELGKLNLKDFKNPVTGKIEKVDDLVDGKITPEKFQKLFYGSYLHELSEKEKVGYASMIQEFAEKNTKPYNLTDKIEIEVTDKDGKKRVIGQVNYGFSEFRKQVMGIKEKQEQGTALTDEEKEIVKRYDAVSGQLTGRMNRTPANRFLNSMRAADIDVQYADDETAKLDGFEGEGYGGMHDYGAMIMERLGVPHATMLRNRKHELQLRGVIPFGAKGEEIAPEDFSLERAGNAAAANPPVMEIFLSDQTPETRIKIYEEAKRQIREKEVIVKDPQDSFVKLDMGIRKAVAQREEIEREKRKKAAEDARAASRPAPQFE